MIIKAVVNPVEMWCRKVSDDGTPCTGRRVGTVVELNTSVSMTVSCGGIAYEIVGHPGFFYCEHNVTALD